MILEFLLFPPANCITGTADIKHRRDGRTSRAIPALQVEVKNVI